MALPSENEAEAKLQALSAERDRLDQRIADYRLYLQLGRRLSGEAGDVGVDAGLPHEKSILSSSIIGFRSPRDHGRAILAAAAEALREAGAPLHARAILAGLKARGVEMAGSDPVAALNTRLWKHSRPQDQFRRLGDAVYTLREDASP